MSNTKRKAATSELTVPKFRRGADEARWWASHQAELVGQFESAAAEGRLGRGSVLRRGETPTTTIRLAPDDISLAKMQARRKGLRYQTYLKMLLRQALLKEEKRSA
jgi:hypothetical protein